MIAITQATEPADLPNAPGAYVLAIDLVHPFALHLPGKPPVDLQPGRYLYAGSAKGPGGIRARVGRHVKSGKPVRWHVDRLTNLAGVSQALALPGGDECTVLAVALGLDSAVVPSPGFGASDCVTCPAHLVKVSDDLDVSVLAAGVTDAVIWRRLPVMGVWQPDP